MTTNKELEIMPNTDFYNIFTECNIQVKNIQNIENQLDDIFGGWAFFTFIMPLTGFYVGGKAAFLITLTSLILLIATATLYPKFLFKKKDKLMKDKNLINLLYSEKFHKSLFPYLNDLVQQYPQLFTYEVEESGKKVVVNRMNNLKNLLISDYSPENFTKIKSELESINKLVVRIEEEKSLSEYEKQIGVEVSLQTIIHPKKGAILENELVKML